MRTTIIICSILTALSIVNSCIFVANRKMQRYDERYEQLVKGQNPTNNISTVSKDIVKFLNTPMFNQWNDEHGTVFLKNVKCGYVVYHAFMTNDEFIPIIGHDTVMISNSNCIAMKMNWNDMRHTKYDGTYLEFIYRGLKYFIVVFYTTNTASHSQQIFGNCIPVYLNIGCGIDTVRNSAFCFRNVFAHQTYISRWKMTDDEWIKVFRDDNNDICLQFMKDKES